GVVGLLLLDRPWDCPADRVTLQDLEGRYLIDADDPDAFLSQPCRIGIAPKDLLRPLLEPPVQPCRLPVAGAGGLQIDVSQNASHGAWADASNDPVRHGLAGQVLAGPVRDVQPFGHGFQTSEFDDLCPLHGGDPQVTPGVALPVIGEQSGEPQIPVALTGSPNGGFVALPLSGKVFSPLAGSNSQDNPGTSDLIPGRRLAVSNPLQLRDIWREDRQHLGLASTHGSTSHVDTGQSISIARYSNLVQLFVPATLEGRRPSRTRQSAPLVPNPVQQGGRRFKRDSPPAYHLSLPFSRGGLSRQQPRHLLHVATG